MKNLIKLKPLFILCLVICFTSCRIEHKEVSTTIEMQKVTGEWIKATYTLPEGHVLYIEDHRGSYSLRYQSPHEKWYHPLQGGKIRSGIIDYKYCR